MFKLFWIMAFRTWVQSTLYEIYVFILIRYDLWLYFVDFIRYSKYKYLTYIHLFASIFIQLAPRDSLFQLPSYILPQLIPEARSLFACSPRVPHLSRVEFLLFFSLFFPQSWIRDHHGSICRERYRTSSWKCQLFFKGNHRLFDNPLNVGPLHVLTRRMALGFGGKFIQKIHLSKIEICDILELTWNSTSKTEIQKELLENWNSLVQLRFNSRKLGYEKLWIGIRC